MQLVTTLTIVIDFHLFQNLESFSPKKSFSSNKEVIVIVENGRTGID